MANNIKQLRGLGSNIGSSRYSGTSRQTGRLMNNVGNNLLNTMQTGGELPGMNPPTPTGEFGPGGPGGYGGTLPRPPEHQPGGVYEGLSSVSILDSLKKSNFATRPAEAGPAYQATPIYGMSPNLKNPLEFGPGGPGGYQEGAISGVRPGISSNPPFMEAPPALNLRVPDHYSNSKLSSMQYRQDLRCNPGDPFCK